MNTAQRHNFSNRRVDPDGVEKRRARKGDSYRCGNCDHYLSPTRTKPYRRPECSLNGRSCRADDDARGCKHRHMLFIEGIGDVSPAVSPAVPDPTGGSDGKNER